MKFLTVRKDGGPESAVTGFWLIEIKCLFSIVLLRFDGNSREAFHTHAFNCVSWVLRGGLSEEFLRKRAARWHPASWRPFITRRLDFHKVSSPGGASWVLSFRGPWADFWCEYLPKLARYQTLTHGRKVVRA